MLTHEAAPPAAPAGCLTSVHDVHACAVLQSPLYITRLSRRLPRALSAHLRWLWPAGSRG